MDGACRSRARAGVVGLSTQGRELRRFPFGRWLYEKLLRQNIMNRSKCPPLASYRCDTVLAATTSGRWTLTQNRRAKSGYWLPLLFWSSYRSKVFKLIAVGFVESLIVLKKVIEFHFDGSQWLGQQRWRCVQWGNGSDATPCTAHTPTDHHRKSLQDSADDPENGSS